MRRGFWYGWRALAGGLAIALLAGSGIAVAAAGANAEAHNRSVDVSCQGITIHGDNYNGDGTNTVTVTIGGVQQTDDNGKLSPITFATGYDGHFSFADPSKSYSYSAQISGHDGYGMTKEGDSVPCLAPAVAVNVDTCSVAGGTLDLTAALDQLDGSHAYAIALASGDAGGTNIATTDIPAGFTAPKYGYVFHDVIPGHVYTVTVTDKTTGLSGQGVGTSVGCPKDSGIDVTASDCAVDGGTGGLAVAVSNLSLGRAYTVNVLNASNVVVGSKAVVGDLGGTASLSFDVAGGGSYKATITDDKVGTSSTKSSELKAFLPCPRTPFAPEVDPTQCTSTDGKANSSISFSASGLVAGRQYQVTVSDGANVVYDSKPFVASASNWPADVAQQMLPVGPGKYTVTVTDVVLTTFATASVGEIGPCPKLSELSITPTQCTVPGGAASVAASVSATSYIPGRTYLVGLTQAQGGSSVVAPAPFAAPQSGAWALPSFGNLTPNAQYRVTVTDSVVPTVSAYGDIAITPCPGVPTVALQVTCNLLGASTVNVSLDKLEPTEKYTVNIVNSASRSYGSTAVTSATPSVTLKLPGIPNGGSYVVNVANATGTLTGSAGIFLKKCDLPTLAFTGANPVGPAVAGIGFLQLGFILIGINLVVRRRRTA